MTCHHQWRKDVCIVCGELMSEQPDNDWDHSPPPRPQYRKTNCYGCAHDPCICVVYDRHERYERENW